MKNTNYIEIGFSDKKIDSLGASVLSDIEEDLGIEGIDSVRTGEAYYFEDELKEPEKVAENVFVDPLTQNYSVNKPLQEKYAFLIEVFYHDDVTDNIGMVAKESTEDFLGSKLEGRVRTGRRYYISGNISKKHAERIAKELLSNDVIENFKVKANE